jgi:hypothetical protein
MRRRVAFALVALRLRRWEYDARMTECRIDHPHLLGFFNGAYDLVRGAFSASDQLSAESKGTFREQIIRETLANVLPPFVRLEPGDIIDSEGRQTGQLDNVAVEHRSPTLKLSPNGNGFILAEGALGVIELKSNLSKQWAEVKGLFKKVIPIAPYLHVTSTGGHVDFLVPLFVVGAEGWATEETAVERLADLVGMEGNDPRRHIFVINLARRAIVAHVKKGGEPFVLTFSEEQRGGVLGELVFQLTARARALHDRPIPYRAYVQKRATRQFEEPSLYPGYHDLVTSPPTREELTGELSPPPDAGGATSAEANAGG